MLFKNGFVCVIAVFFSLLTFTCRNFCYQNLESLNLGENLTYLKLSGLHLGLLLNFNTTVLPNGIVRIVNNLEE